MPTYKYEALDTSGAEVKDSVEATNEEEASQKIKAMGYFVTKLTAVAGGKKGKAKKKGGKSRKTFTRMHVGFINVNADKAKCALVAASRV